MQDERVRRKKKIFVWRRKGEVQKLAVMGKPYVSVGMFALQKCHINEQPAAQCKARTTN